MNSAIVKQSLQPQPEQIHAASSSEPATFHLDLARSLRMHRTLAIAVALATFAIVFAYGLSRKPYYETQALIYVQPVKEKLITDSNGGLYDSGRYDSYIQQQLQTINRADILTEALSKPSTFAWRFPGESDRAAVARLQQTLKVERDQGSYQISISLGGGNAQAVANVVNAVSEAYIRGERTDELAQSDQQLTILKDERSRISSNLAASRQEQRTLSSKLGVADTTNDISNPYDAQLTELRTQLAAASASRAVASVQLDSITGSRSADAAGLDAAADTAADTDPGLIAFKQTISQRLSLLSTQMAGLTPRNPLYQQDQQETKNLRQNLEEATRQVRAQAAEKLREKLKLDADRTASIESRLQGQIAQQSALASDATPLLQRLADLSVDVTRMQTRYTDVDNAINAIELEKNTAGLVHVLLPATPPLNPKASKKLFILAGAFPLAFLLGAGAAVFAQKLDPKIYVGDDVARVLTFEPMAILPDPSDVTPSTVEEFMLRLVAGVDQAHRTGGARTFVFTSATPGASITPIVAAVAHMMERYGYSAMLLDASTVLENVALPKEEPSYLLGDIEIARPSQVRLANTKRDTYTIGNFSKIKKNVDLLFIEGLPLLASAESEFAARLADVTILVAESANTTRTQLASSLALVKRLGVPGVAAVLSGVSLRYADTQFLTVVQDVEQRQASTPVRPPAPQPVESAPEPAAAEPAIPRQDYDLYTRDKKVASTR